MKAGGSSELQSEVSGWEEGNSVHRGGEDLNPCSLEIELTRNPQRVIFQFGLGGGGVGGTDWKHGSQLCRDVGVRDLSTALSLGRWNFGEAGCFGVKQTHPYLPSASCPSVEDKPG